MIVFPNCKINLGLFILNKRADGFHDLQTIFYPVALQDALEVIQHPKAGSSDCTITVSGIPLDTQAENNICTKAYRLLKKDIPGLPSVLVHLHKIIPSGAGLGGGSSDGSFMLLLLNKKFNLGLTDEQLGAYALQLGSDCPFFLKNLPCMAEGRGEKISPLKIDLSTYKLVIIHPGIHVSTGWAFSKISPSNNRPSLWELVQKPIEEWKDLVKNDFEPVVFRAYPEVAGIKDLLYEKGALYASMSGSGSSVYGFFEKEAAPVFDLPSSWFIRQI